MGILSIVFWIHFIAHLNVLSSTRIVVSRTIREDLLHEVEQVAIRMNVEHHLTLRRRALIIKCFEVAVDQVILYM